MFSIKVSKLRFYFIGFLFVILYRYLLDLNYVDYIAKNHAYQGLVDASNFGSKILSWVYLLIYAPFFLSFHYYQKELFLSIVMMLFFLLKFIPSTCLLAFLDTDPMMFVSQIAFWFLMILLAYGIPPVHIPRKNTLNYNSVFNVIVLVFCLVIIYISGRYTGFRLNFSLLNIYDLRFEARTWNYPVIFDYIVGASNVILPLMLISFLERKKRIIAFFLGFVIFLNFSTAGHKSVLFMLFLSLLSYYFFQTKYIKFFPLILSAIMVLAFLEYRIFHSTFVDSLIVFRVLLLPSYLDYYYYDFFTTHTPDFFQQSFLRYLGFTSDYDMDIYYMISKRYAGTDSMANNGLLSEAYTNFGVLGSLFLPFVYIGILKLLSACSKGLDVRIIIIPIISVTIALISASFSIFLLT